MRKGLIIFFGLIGLGAFDAWLTHRPANQMHDAIRPGLTVTEFLRAGQEWSMCNFSATPSQENNPHFAIHGKPGAYRLSALSSYAEDKDGKVYPVSVEQMATLVEKRMRESGKSWKAQVHFFGAIPRRVYFVVSFGPDQRVQEVSEVKWAD